MHMTFFCSHRDRTTVSLGCVQPGCKDQSLSALCAAFWREWCIHMTSFALNTIVLSLLLVLCWTLISIWLVVEDQ